MSAAGKRWSAAAWVRQIDQGRLRATGCQTIEEPIIWRACCPCGNGDVTLTGDANSRYAHARFVAACNKAERFYWMIIIHGDSGVSHSKATEPSCDASAFFHSAEDETRDGAPDGNSRSQNSYKSEHGNSGGGIVRN